MSTMIINVQFGLSTENSPQSPLTALLLLIWFALMLLYVHRDRSNYYGWGAQDVLLDSHTAPELCSSVLLYDYRDRTDY